MPTTAAIGCLHLPSELTGGRAPVGNHQFLSMVLSKSSASTEDSSAFQPLILGQQAASLHSASDHAEFGLAAVT